MEFTVVSEGTLREKDLIPAFISALDDVKEEYALDVDGDELERTQNVAATDNFLASIEEQSKEPGYYEEEWPTWHIDELFDRINQLLPEDWEFSTLDGDGACFVIREATDIDV